MNRTLLFVITAWIAGLAAVSAAPVRSEHTEVELVAAVNSIQPGVAFPVGLRMKMDPEWHTYYKDPGESGLPTEIKWMLPDGFTAGEIQWPPYKTIEVSGIKSNGYEGEILLRVDITPPADLAAGGLISLRADVTWLECKEECLPGAGSVSLELPVKSTSPELNSATAPLFKQSNPEPPPVSSTAKTGPGSPEISLGLALLYGLVGGLILNLMPCVFPIISIKIMGFVQQAHEQHSRPWLHGLVFAAGIVISFLLLGGILLALQAAGEQIGWGFQLQSPVFVFCLAALFFLLGLSFFGVFEIGTSLTGMGQGLSGPSGLGGTFFSGFLATLVATPCTAPFMGAAMGFTLTQSPQITLAIFGCIGLGMALPYVLFSSSSRLLGIIPKPGRWMETLKQAMGFVLMATVLWLAWVLSIQRGNEVLMPLMVSLLIVGVGGWVLGRWNVVSRPAATRVRGTIAAALLVAGGLGYGIVNATAAKASSASMTVWEPWSPEAVTAARAAGDPVFIDFTAAWCITCQANKKTTLHTERVNRAFREKGVRTFKADWTDKNETITRALAGYQRTGVPVYVLYDGQPDSDPRLLPAILTPGIVLEALEDIKP